MITFSRAGVKVLEVSRTGVTIGTVFDSFLGDDGTRGRQFFDGIWYDDGFGLWAGRLHLILECPPLARLVERLFTPPTATA